MEAVFVLYHLLEKPCMDLSYTISILWKYFLRVAFTYLNRMKTCFNFFHQYAEHLFLSVEWEVLCLKIFQLITANWILIFIGLLMVNWFYKRQKIHQHKDTSPSTFLKKEKYSVSELCNVIKDCDNPIFAKEVVSLLEDAKLDINAVEPNSCSGLTPFLCACMSGNMELVEYMLKQEPHLELLCTCSLKQNIESGLFDTFSWSLGKATLIKLIIQKSDLSSNIGPNIKSVGANINSQTACQDGPLHIATFACANQNSKECFDVLAILIKAGCDLNSKNWLGNTPLCIAASYDRNRLIRYLLFQGADPSICNNDGVYPIDFATNAGNTHIASLLAINLPNPHVWDFIEPHTPPRIKLGLQTPSKQHLAQSSFNQNKRKLNTFRTPRPIRTRRL